MTDSISEKILVEAEVEVRPSEDIEKVKTALSKVLTGSIETVEIGQNRFILRLNSDQRSSLERLKMIIQRDRIRAAARAVLNRHMQSETLEVFLNKQVAYAGHVSFSQPEGESPLGPIRLVIRSSNLGKIVDWLTSGS
jgi:uncharacterized protein